MQLTSACRPTRHSRAADAQRYTKGSANEKDCSLFHRCQCFCYTVYAQNKDPIWDQDQVADATVLLIQGRGGASATIVVKDTSYYLLTASHVAKELKDSSKVVFRLKGDKPGIYDLLPLTKAKSMAWKHHPVADVAMLELDIGNAPIKTIIQERAFPAEFVYSGKELPKRDVDLTFLGYPVVDMEMEHFSPLLFTAYLSSGLITQQRYDTGTKCNFFFLNVPGIEGCSGSGVFFSVKKAMFMAGKATLMIGIMHGTKGDNTGGKLAAVTPSYYAAELLKEQ